MSGAAKERLVRRTYEMKLARARMISIRQRISVGFVIVAVAVDSIRGLKPILFADQFLFVQGFQWQLLTSNYPG